MTNSFSDPLGHAMDRIKELEAEVSCLREGLRKVKAKWEWFWGWVDAYVTNEEHCDAAEAVDEALKEALKE